MFFERMDSVNEWPEMRRKNVKECNCFDSRATVERGEGRRGAEDGDATGPLYLAMDGY